jgi:hypothetical protein
MANVSPFQITAGTATRIDADQGVGELPLIKQGIESVLLKSECRTNRLIERILPHMQGNEPSTAPSMLPARHAPWQARLL